MSLFLGQQFQKIHNIFQIPGILNGDSHILPKVLSVEGISSSTQQNQVLLMILLYAGHTDDKCRNKECMTIKGNAENV